MRRNIKIIFICICMLCNIVPLWCQDPCKCPPGMHVLAPCNEQSKSASCQVCPPETFQNYSSTAKTCKPCKNDCVQYDNQVLSGKCTPFHDRECVCEQGRYFNMQVDRCLSWTQCPKGQGVSVNGTHLKNVECSNCSLGSFSNVTSNTEACRPCKKCPILLEKCTNHSDTVCSTSQHATDDANQMVPLILAGGLLLITAIMGPVIYFCCWKKMRQKTSTEGLEMDRLQPVWEIEPPREMSSSFRNEERDCLDETFWFCSRNMANRFYEFYLYLPGEQAWRQGENGIAFKQVRMETNHDSYQNFIVKALKKWEERNPLDASQLNVYHTICDLELCDVQRAFEEEFPEFTLKRESCV